MGIENVCINTGTNTICGIATLRGFEGIFANIVSIVLSVASIALLLLLISGGFKYITSAGDPAKVDGAKKTLTSAILGIVLIASALLVLRIIELFTGVPTHTFRVGFF